MTLSLAYDDDLTYQRRDLERFSGLYRWGPDGIFLKRGKQLRLRVRRRRRSCTCDQLPDRRTDRLYFGKAMIYPVVAAPFVRLLGMNGFLVLHVLLLFGVCVCGYLFLAARSRPGAGAHVHARVRRRVLRSGLPRLSDAGDLQLLARVRRVLPVAVQRSRARRSGLARSCAEPAATSARRSCSAWRRTRSRATRCSSCRSSSGCGGGAVRRGAHWLAWLAVAMAGALFGVNALISGEFNYQGGDRKTFYGHIRSTPRRAACGIARASRRARTTRTPRTCSTDFANRFAHNVEYFLVGRHFGFVPYFFPGVVAIGLWLVSRERFQPGACSRFSASLGVGRRAAGVLSVHVERRRRTARQSLLHEHLRGAVLSDAAARDDGAGDAGVDRRRAVHREDPRQSVHVAKYPTSSAERGFARRLPVELTMGQDLPMMLECAARRALVYGDLLLYFLDDHAYIPEVVDAEGHRGIWIAGDGRADIVMRSEWPIRPPHDDGRVADPHDVHRVGGRQRVADSARAWEAGDDRCAGRRASAATEATPACSRRDRPTGSCRTCAILVDTTRGISAC